MPSTTQPARQKSTATAAAPELASPLSQPGQPRMPERPTRPVGPTADYLAAKAVSDAALAWAAQSRKLAVREDALARSIRAARDAGIPAPVLREVIEAAEKRAENQLDPASLEELLK
ncbi:hypothetical protein FOS14_19615 [Skermania sp. ID1734]|uniref:hypothetical protein n=1 Tax=Skermania sp. ID1734 TaxID=2597516 RepID=UPI00117F9DE6|nr:hypothetical protein [Skermania sp. ID1734]TSD94852.1 hypothetical protein FOS14_19615 [Skermania sp. ID1734]